MAPDRPEGAQRRRELADHLSLLLDAYENVFHGDAQILAKLKAVIALIPDPDQARWCKALKKQKRVRNVRALLEERASPEAKLIVDNDESTS